MFYVRVPDSNDAIQTFYSALEKSKKKKNVGTKLLSVDTNQERKLEFSIKKFGIKISEAAKYRVA